ncbi:class I SAM-dependent RNA methyltransferase [Lentisphaera profundi]|uniref:Class I SAM-dependent RNA methyltransferase n=1 Tax=Lentisphaera profundi TaxID=1658616 RepID=A0ABY7VR79_9BACT|nr:class I SAM-dependent RNA methyltransferase [Lentisphaera profundi]WDE95834.1 class I SAM-dependent RNA methyltransferase [Lentisphaera profundi]
MEREEIFEIDNIAYGGDGAGRMEDGRVCFVPFSVPGEKVKVKILKDNKNFCRGEIVEIVEASEKRAEAPCQYYGECGGCSYQHMTYDEQVTVKEAQFRQVLKRLGGLDIDNDDIEIVPSVNQWNYRNRISLNARRTENDEVIYGFIGRDNRSLVRVKECLLAQAPVNEQVPGLSKTKWGHRNSKRDRPLRATIRHASSNKETVAFYGKAPVGLPWRREIYNDKEYVMPSGSFSQVNREVAEALQSMCAEIISSLKECTFVIDAFCGSGFLSMELKGVRVVGLEIDDKGVEAANFNAQEHGLTTHKYIAGDVNKLLRQRLGKLIGETTLILDPPRAGVGPGTIKAISKRSPRWILYVSCDPGTLARDLKEILPLGYKHKKLAMLDMFPQTAHFESLILLELDNA